jgi:hypothetical protein
MQQEQAPLINYWNRAPYTVYLQTAAGCIYSASTLVSAVLLVFGAEVSGSEVMNLTDTGKLMLLTALRHDVRLTANTCGI